MWKWLRSWFAWRFSLTRLVVAVVFLGAVVGLNVRKIGPRILTKEGRIARRHSWMIRYSGWPLPFMAEMEPYDPSPPGAMHFLWPGSPEALQEEARFASAENYELPWTHQAYRMLNWRYHPTPSRAHFVVCAVIDVLVGLIPLALILFLQIPRRKVAARVE